MTLISTLGRQTQVDLCEFETGHTVISRTVRATERDLVLKTKTKTNKKHAFCNQTLKYYS